MTAHRLRAMVEGSDTVLADGAMGTMLFEAGLVFGDPPELWNLERSEVVSSIQRAYVQAGAQLLLTNTFGGSRFRLRQHGLHERVHELNRAGAANLRTEIEKAGSNALVAGDVGPSGEIMAPLGELEFEDAVAGFTEQCGGLVAGGVDFIWIETMSAVEELRAAVSGVRKADAEIPIIATMSFDTHGHTMMGVSPEDAVRTMVDLGVFAAGGNCGSGTTEMLQVLERMYAAAPDAVLVAKSNAGVPELEDGKAVYRADPDVMAEFALAARARGARIIGGCCGTRPEHIRAMAAALQSQQPPDE
ncbi:MAG: betaine--homocysteine S-methyltransferase [Anaerolineales bacterium]|nr:betaine--homocysteine S-methyltransferase [Anaerolineales bacterium]HJO33654.1 betaine--homocysteine S-methyltransferase [Anaerolineales bacterium]